MGVVSRWTAAVASSLVCFGGCWAGLAAERVLNTGSQVWVASVLSLVVLTVLGLWAGRARENPAEDAQTEHASEEVTDSPQGQEIGQVGDGTPLPGAGHPRTPTSRSNLAAASGAAGKTEEAVALLERTLADHERQFGADHPDTLTSRSNLAKAYLTAGRPAEAFPLLERMVADCERLYGADHPDTFTSRNTFAKAYLTAGRPAEAIPLLERTLADRGRVLGADHPNTLMSRSVLAGAYLAAGRSAEALPLFERMVADSERLHGAGHPSTNILLMNLAALKSRVGDASCVSPGK
jgi:tetratricopeptide (TPR) repeat protein